VRRIVARVAAPVVFLAAVTAVVLILRSGLHETAAVAPAIGLSTSAAVMVTMLPPVFCDNICLIASWVR